MASREFKNGVKSVQQLGAMETGSSVVDLKTRYPLCWIITTIELLNIYRLQGKVMFTEAHVWLLNSSVRGRVSEVLNISDS